MSQGNNTKLVVALLMLGAIASYMVNAKKKPTYKIPYDDFDGNNYENLSGEEQQLLERFYKIKDIEPGANEVNMSYGDPIPPPTEGEAMGELINFNITNNTNSDIPIVSILGNNQDRMDNANATTSYVWDLTNFTFTNETQVLINYKWSNAPTLSAYQQSIATITTPTFIGLVNALNTLELGSFFISNVGGNTYLNNYNLNVVFGELTIYAPNSTPSIINPTFVNYGLSGSPLEVYCCVDEIDNQIVLGGNINAYDIYTAENILRINQGGSYDSSFDTSFAFNGYPTTMEIQTDSKILVGGNFTTYKGVSVGRVVRLNSNATLDNTFTLATLGTITSINRILVQSDGKILVCGNFTYSGHKINLIKLNTDGTLDSTFTNNFAQNTLAQVEFYDIAIQTDGKIVIVGNVTFISPATLKGIARINSDGTNDTTFNTNTGTGFATGIPRCVALQSDGKIVVGGNFTTYQGITSQNLVRINSDGSRDNTFNTSTGFVGGDVLSIRIDGNGKIYCGGSFTSYKSTPSNFIARINSDASYDSTWNVGSGFLGGFVYQIELINNTIFCVGGFTTFNGQSALGMISLLPSAT